MFKKKASAKTKAKIMEVIANSEFAYWYEGFATQDFVLVRYKEGRYHRNYWASTIGDVTIIVWERGTNVEDWCIQAQCW
ncbi:MAG: hypothetical protein IJX99_07610 [Clostridia bacterium]|nr:hypothetical protein [Clostridia bacterium]